MGIESEPKAGIGYKVLPNENDPTQEVIFKDFEYWVEENLEDKYRGVLTGDCWTENIEFYIWLNLDKYSLMNFDLNEESTKLKDIIQKLNFKIDSHFDLHETIYCY